MTIEIRPYTKDRIDDVLRFEHDLRKEEDFWGWEINDQYIADVKASFEDPSFGESISLLAYAGDRVVGRIDSSMIKSHFDGSVKAYLDWVCVLKSFRHRGAARALLDALKKTLKKKGITTLIALTASNDEAQRFYRNIPDSKMGDIGIWIDIR